MENISKFVPIEERGSQEYSPERADALVINYHEKLQSIKQSDTIHFK